MGALGVVDVLGRTSLQVFPFVYVRLLSIPRLNPATHASVPIMSRMARRPVREQNIAPVCR